MHRQAVSKFFLLIYEESTVVQLIKHNFSRKVKNDIIVIHKTPH